MGDPSTDNDIGIVDSGCSRSMTGNKEKLDDFVQIKGGIVKFGGGDGRISGKGTIRTSKLDFENVYYVEELQHFNLFSVSQICDKKNKVLFTDTDCLVLSEEFQLPDARQVVLRIPRKHDLYTFHISDLQPEQKVTCLVAKASLDESTRWHRRMAHVNFKTINKLAKEGLVDGLPLKVFTNEHNCVACNKGKQHKASYKHISAVRLITETLQLLHMDLFGPTNIRSIDQKYYSLVVTDDFSRVKLMKVILLGMLPIARPIGFIIYQTKGSGNLNLRVFRDKTNVHKKLNINAGPSSSNGPSVMERNADYAEELAKLQRQEYEAKDAAARYGYLFSQATAEILCQAEAEIRNQGVSAVRDPAGIDSAVRDPAGIDSAVRDTAAINSAGDESAGSPSAGSDPACSSVSADFIPVYADESTLPPGQSLGSSANTTRFPLPSDVCMDQLSSGIFTSSSYDDFRATLTNLAPAVEVNPVPTKRVNTIHPQSQILGDLASPVMTRSRAQKSKFGEIRTNQYRKPLEDPDWVAAMQEEMQQFINQQVWKLVPLPDGKHAIGTKWILKNKRDARGIVVRNKASWTLRVPFFYREIDEKSPRDWYARLSAFLLQHNYRRGTIDKTLFIKKDSRDILLVQVYVDDIIFGSTNKAWCDDFEVLMKGEFEMSAMGEMNFFLGLQVKQLPDGIFISQDKYVKDMLTKFDMESVRTATTPYEAAKTKLKDETDPPVNVHLYRSMIGSLMYLTASRPDIMFAVACSRHQVTPLTSHLNAVKKIFKYLKGQPKLGLWYPKDSPFQLEAYSDSDYAGSHGDRKSTTGSWIRNQRTKHIEIQHHFIRDANEKNLIQVLKIHTDDNVADLLTKAFDGDQDLLRICVHILGMVVNTATRCIFFLLTGLSFCWSYYGQLVVILSAGRLVSAGRTMVLLVVILSAGRLVSAGRTMVLLVVILSAGRLVSAGRTMVLLVVIVPAGCFVFAAVYAANTSIYAAELVCAGSIKFLLANLFLLVVTCFCCLNFVSAVLKDVDRIFTLDEPFEEMGSEAIEVPALKEEEFAQITVLGLCVSFPNGDALSFVLQRVSTDFLMGIHLRPT
ncbi:putative ribonuclease H-like domain-containing protein [Tanacetum coccineum]